MKKIALSVIMTISSLVTIGQCNPPVIPCNLDTIYSFEEYLYAPSCIRNGIYPLILRNILNPAEAWTDTTPNIATLTVLASTVYTRNAAQPYYTDSIISIIGIAGQIGNSYNLPYVTDTAYLQIHKPLGNVIANIPVDTVIPALPGMMFPPYEKLLDNPILVKDTFGVVLKMHDTRQGQSELGYNNAISQVKISFFLPFPGEKARTPLCCEQMSPYVTTVQNPNWQPLFQSTAGNNAVIQVHILDNGDTCYPFLYIFSILDTTPIFSRATTTITDDITNGTFTFVTNIDTSNCLTLPSEVGFIYSTDTTGGLTLENPLVSVINYLYDTTTNSFTDYINYYNFPCNTLIYYRT
ncbi:MAG: hypothetical protein LBR17_05130, partial [Bacteroidales bacterium]|nr:hypothetical protein [Bacteroidales bacterium]